ncbi:hypothetical protein G4B88_005587 [Cannabis sativa]|uniref:Uncharacterized protein n=1 Tax=Cannabis sativa TaxID=3483 RepID=A0A7J6H9S6_CANSA|nr:hypothetical protein G4B88_005587 [Cannabis sativa]
MVLNLLCYMSKGIATGEACEERDRRRFHLSIRSQPPRRPKKRPRNIQRQLHFSKPVLGVVAVISSELACLPPCVGVRYQLQQS